MFTTLPLMLFGDRGRRKALATLLGVDLLNEAAELKNFGEFMILVLKDFRGRTGKLPVFSKESLRRLKMPVLAILGGRDAIFDSAETKDRLQDCVPQAEIHFLPDAGHGLLDQKDTILEFLHRTANAAQG